jgi:hypothetical protein
LGEYEQARPLIEKIKKLQPEYTIVLTFFSPSGYEVRKQNSVADFTYYLPFDTLVFKGKDFTMEPLEKRLQYTLSIRGLGGILDKTGKTILVMEEKPFYFFSDKVNKEDKSYSKNNKSE